MIDLLLLIWANRNDCGFGSLMVYALPVFFTLAGVIYIIEERTMRRIVKESKND